MTYFQRVAGMKRFRLPWRRAVADDAHDTPGRLPRKTFPSGVKLLYSPDNSAIEYVTPHIHVEKRTLISLA